MPSLDPGCVHVLRASADAPPMPLVELERVLSPEERERAARFRLERDHRRAIAAWGLLRATLGSLTGRDPASLRFVRSPAGKPHLQGGPSFNLSHSADQILIAAALEGRVGADIEVVRPIDQLEHLAERTLSAEELRDLRGRRPEDRRRAFFRIWTLKEAFVKAVGDGLALPFEAFSVSLASCHDQALTRVEHRSERVSGWCLRTVACGGTAEGAVAWDRPRMAIRPLDAGLGASVEARSGSLEAAGC